MTCPTTKRKYNVKSQATKAAKRQGHRVYKCEHCGQWHTTKDKRGPVSQKVVKLPTRAVEKIWEM